MQISQVGLHKLSHTSIKLQFIHETDLSSFTPTYNKYNNITIIGLKGITYLQC